MQKKWLASFPDRESQKKLWKIMKLTIGLIIGFIMTVSANSYSQKTKLDVKLYDTTIKGLFDYIEQNSEFVFLYQSTDLNTGKKIDIELKEATINQILDQALKGENVSFDVYERQIVLRKLGEPASTQQQKFVSGKVTDNKGVSLPGVSVVVKGTTIGIITDSNGNYSLVNVPDKAILQFSFVGMKAQEIVATNKTTVNVMLEDDVVGIEEVVAIGYGSMKKSDLTGAVVKADIKSFKESPNVSILQSLQGNIPGLNVGQVNTSGQDPSITIRGRNSISGSQKPLIVLDGTIYRGNIVDINVNDVESVDVLKDASSAAIYGSESANGVIIITTKSGQNHKGKPEINYSFSNSFSSPSNIIKPVGREEAIKLIYDHQWRDSRLAPDYITPNPAYDIVKYLKNTQQVDGYENGTDTDWMGLLTQTGLLQSHNISITGGNENHNYFVSFGTQNQKGWLIHDDFKKYNLKINLDNHITDWFTIGLQSLMTIIDNSGAKPSVGNNFIHSFYTAFDENGAPVLQPTGATVINPLLLKDIDDLNKRINLLGSVYAKIDIPFINGLSYKIAYSNNFALSNHYVFDKYDNSFQGTGSKAHTLTSAWTLDNQISFERVFSKNHKINATFVYGRENRTSESTNAGASVFSNDLLGYNALEAGNPANLSVSSGAWAENSLYSMGRLFYSFKHKYLVTGTIRRDGFSGFGADHKTGIFPSVALAWIPTEEKFMKSISWLDNLKLRASYGTNGNRTIGRYSTLAQIQQAISYIYGDNGSPVLGKYVNSLSNQDIRWEKTTGLNLGLDFAIFDRRLSGSIEYYDTKTNDLLYNINIPVMTGFSNINSNIGEIKNHGLEVNLNTVIIRNTDWNWQTSLNFSLNRNKVVTILGKDNNNDGVEDDIVSSGIFINKPIGVFYDYQIVGMWQINDVKPAGFNPGNYKLKDQNGDSLITAAADRVILGYTDPGYRISLQSNLRYQNWNLNVFVNSIQGGKNYYFANGNPYWNTNVGGVDTGGSPMFDYWTPENPNAKYEGLNVGSSPAARLPLQRNFVRLQDVTLSYDFNYKLFQKYSIKGKVFVNGKNILTLTKWEGWDPETGQGLINDGQPVMKSYTLGLDITL